ncbi:hypothetical protein E4U52_000538 [Claviceps spartinae]|nr:hypothetical protein E4U52_000538 [Claviceps spartinae]
MAWIDYEDRQEEVELISAEAEHAAHNFNFQHHGLPEMWRKAAASQAAEELEYEQNNEHEFW